MANASLPSEASVSGHIEQGHFARYARVVERLNAILVIDDKPEVHQAVALALEPWVDRVRAPRRRRRCRR